jgi:hypothetical protein
MYEHLRIIRMDFWSGFLARWDIILFWIFGEIFVVGIFGEKRDDVS